MATLDEVIGSLIASITQARRIADEEAIRVAEVYKQHETLRGLSVPRVRLPDVQIDLPIVIESYINPQGEIAQAPSPVANRVVAAIDKLAVQDGLKLTAVEKTTLSKILLGNYQSALKAKKSTVTSRELFINATQRSLSAIAKNPRVPSINITQVDKWQVEIIDIVAANSVKVPPAPAKLVVNVLTEQVKQKSDPANVIRLKLSLKEEGLEWHSSEQNGNKHWQLAPE